MISASVDAARISVTTSTLPAIRAYIAGAYTLGRSNRAHIAGAYTLGRSNRAHIAGAYTLGRSNRSHISGVYTVARSNREIIAGAYFVEPYMLPGKPFLYIVSADVHEIIAQTSPFEAPAAVPGMTHLASEWQVAEDSSFTDIVTAGESETALESAVLDIASALGTSLFVRVRHVGLEEFVDPETNEVTPIQRYSEWSDTAELDLTSVPDTPVLSLVVATTQTISVATTAYSDPVARPHQSTEWEIQLTNDGDEPETIQQVVDTEALEEFTFEALLTAQTYRARARHINTLGLASDWSEWLDTATEIGNPGKPWVEEVAEPVLGTYVIASGPYQAGNLAPAHASTRYQIALDSEFSSIVLDTNFIADLLNYQTSVIVDVPVGYVRLAHRDADGGTSEFSDAFPYSFEKALYAFAADTVEEAPPDWEKDAIVGGIVPWFGYIRVVPRQGFTYGKGLELNIQTNFAWVPAFTSIGQENHYAAPRPGGEPIIMQGRGRARIRMQLTEDWGQNLVSAGGPMQAGLMLNLGTPIERSFRAWIANGMFRLTGANIDIPGFVTKTEHTAREGDFVTIEMNYFWAVRQWVTNNPGGGVPLIRVTGMTPNVIATLIREKTGETWTIGGFSSYNVLKVGGSLVGDPPPREGEFAVFGQRTEGIKYFDYLSLAHSGQPINPPVPPTPIIRHPYSGQVYNAEETVTFTWDHPWQDVEEMQHEGQRWTGSAWTSLFSWQSGRTFSISGRSLTPGNTGKIRVRSRVGASGTPSEWSESQEFTVAYNLEGRGSTDFAGLEPNSDLALFDTLLGGAWRIREDNSVPVAQRMAVIDNKNGVQAQTLFTGSKGRIQIKAQSYAVGREIGFIILGREDTRFEDGRLGEHYKIRYRQDGYAEIEEDGHRGRRLSVEHITERGTAQYNVDVLAVVDIEATFSFGSGTFYHFLADVVEVEDVRTLEVYFWREGSSRPEEPNITIDLTALGDNAEPGVWAFYGTGGAYGYAATRAVGVDTVAWDAMLVPFGGSSRSDTLEKAWAFELDGHVMYVLNNVSGYTFIYDVTTRQWYRWFTRSFDFWNMFSGIMWKKRVIAADAELNRVWELDPHSPLDEEQYPISRKVTGFLPIRGKNAARQGITRLTVSNSVGAVVELRFSDDGGKTWVGPFTEVVTTNNFLRWRSLGRLKAPGRIWEISDVGGLTRIDDFDSTLEGI